MNDDAATKETAQACLQMLLDQLASSSLTACEQQLDRIQAMLDRQTELLERIERLIRVASRAA